MRNEAKRVFSAMMDMGRSASPKSRLSGAAEGDGTKYELEILPPLGR
jgi:hypothetical protein